MIRMIFKKQWLDMQGRLWTYPLVALCFSVLSRENPFVGMGVVAVFLALDLANQMAGDDALHGTFEFIFTRAIDRRAYLSMKYFFGIPVLLGFVVFCILIQWLNVRFLFWNLVCELPIAGKAAMNPAVDGGILLVGATGLILLFSIVFLLVSTAVSEASFRSFSLNLVGLIVSAGFAALVFTSLPVFLGVPLTGPDGTSTSFVQAGSAAFLLPSVLIYFVSREVYARRELPILKPGRGSGSFVWVGIILLILMVLMIAFFMLLVKAPDGPVGG